MSVMGTNAAMGVAQAALQAQQVARQRDRHATDAATTARRMQEVLEIHTQAVEEGDESESPTKLRAEASDSQRQGNKQRRDSKRRRQPPYPPATPSSGDNPPPQLDVTA